MPAEEGDKMTELPSSANGTAAVSHHSAASRPRSTLLSVHTIGKNDLGQPFLDRSRGDPENASKTSKVSRVSGLSRVSKLGSLLARAAGRYDEGDDDEDPALAGTIIKASLGVNVMLFFAKIYAYFSTDFGASSIESISSHFELSIGSLAVLASLVDSTIDLLAQGTLMSAHHMANLSIQDAVYPAGVARVEPLGVIVCAVLMVLASVEVVRKSFSTIIQFYGSDDGPPMDFDEDTGILITVVILLKIALWRWCMYASEKSSNVSLEAIGLDNQNDVLSNTAALVSAILAKTNPSWWWADPLGAIIISVYIVWTWIETATEQINMLVGKAADPEFLDYVREIAENHDPDADLDTVRAYHFGPKFIVEIELVMNKNTPLDISHDVGMLLQHRIELLPQCERCFVHIDYQHRENDDHDKNISVRDKVNVSRDWLETKESNGPKNNDGDDMV